jgi:hypothetical protein
MEKLATDKFKLGGDVSVAVWAAAQAKGYERGEWGTYQHGRNAVPRFASAPRRGVIQARRLNAAAPYWIRLNETDEQKLRDWVRNSSRIQKGQGSPSATGGSSL